MGISRDCPKFFKYLLLSKERVELGLYELQILYAHSYDRSEEKPINHPMPKEGVKTTPSCDC